MTPQPYTVHVLAVVLLSALARSTFGFGAAMVAMPLLVFFVPVQVATALMAILSTILAGALIVREWRSVDVSGVWRLLAASIVGIPLGLLLLKGAGDRVARVILGIVIISFSSYCLATPRRSILNRDTWAWPFGVWAGTLGGAFSIYGPPLVVYGTLRGWGAERFRATVQVYLLPVGVLTMIAHATAGLWTLAVGWYVLVSLPVLAVGLLLGTAVNRRFRGEAFVRTMHVLLILLGSGLLVRSFAS
jgi:uncharacterized protein